MPIYEYRCKKCNTVSEFLIIGSKGDRIACSSCGSTALEKMLSVTNVHSKTVTKCSSLDSCGMASPCGGGSCAAGGYCPGKM